MHNPPRVELVPHTSDPDHNHPAVVDAQACLETVRLDGNADVIRAAQDGLTTALAQTQTAGYLARIDGAMFPVQDFAVQHVNGRIVVSLIFEATSLQVGEQLTSQTEFVTDLDKPQAMTPKNERHPVSVWGKPAKDPRSNIPGWTPEVTA